jgi:small-conductance mechanosensitive channel
MSDLVLALSHAALPSWNDVGKRATDVLPALVGALVIVVITLAVSHIASTRMRSTLMRGGIALNVSILISRLVWLTIWVLGFLLVIHQFGLGYAPLATFVGVLGLAASLSLQQLLQNLVAGVYLLAERPFAIGDFIAVVGPAGANHEGKVEDIQMRTTHLRNRDNELILMPNSAVFGGVVTNRTAIGGYVRHLTVTFPRDVDVNAARGTIVPLLQGLPAVLPAPEPVLRVEKVEKGTWTGALSLWGSSPDVDSEVIWAIGQAFPEAGVSSAVVTA